MTFDYCDHCLLTTIAININQSINQISIAPISLGSVARVSSVTAELVFKNKIDETVL